MRPEELTGEQKAKLKSCRDTAELQAMLNTMGIGLTDEQLETVIFQTGEENSIFGLDFPYNNEDYIKADIERIKNLGISETAKQNILGASLARALGE